MDEVTILRSKLKKIIENFNTQMDVSQFELLLQELNALVPDSVSISNTSFASKIFSLIRSKLSKPKEIEFDNEKFEEIKGKSIQLYNDLILKRNYLASISPNDIADANFNCFYGTYPQGKLFYEIRQEGIINARLRETPNGTLEIYPWLLKERDLLDLADDEFLKVSEIFMTTESSVEDSFNKRSEFLSEKNNETKNKFINGHVEPYYGAPEFINERAQYIVQCMEDILASQEVRPDNKVTTRQLIDSARNAVREINQLKMEVSTTRDDSKYKKMKADFEQLLSFENAIMKDVEQIWSEFLTNPKEHKEGERFAYLAHTFTNGVVGAEEMNKCCCTLVTDKCLPIPYGDMGIICNFRSANIGTMCAEDAGSWVVSQEEFFNRGIPAKWQFAENAGDERKRVFYECPQVSKIILPTTMEKKMIENNLQTRSMNLNMRCYTEIFMIKGEHGETIPVQDVFYTGEKGKEKAVEATKGKTNPLFLDPSKGSAIQFYDDKEKQTMFGIEK